VEKWVDERANREMRLNGRRERRCRCGMPLDRRLGDGGRLGGGGGRRAKNQEVDVVGATRWIAGELMVASLA
jgi:hypothetical protein